MSVHVRTCGPRGGVCAAARGTRGTLYEWNVSTPSVAKEAPVCPACKHNNTDVSIHQVDPGGVERPREMPLEAPRELCVRARVCIVLPLSFSLFLLSLLFFSFFFFSRPRQPSAWLFKGRFGSRPRRRRRPRFIYRPSRLFPHSRVQRPIRLRNLVLLEISSLLVPQSGT